MRNARRIVCVMVCCVSMVGIASARPRQVPPTKERTFYSTWDDESIEHFSPVPENVLDALLATQEAKERADRLQGLNRKELSGLFKAVVVHMAGPRELDYLVLGKFPMSGADCDWYWIVRSGSSNPKVILFDNTNSIQVLRKRNYGYKEIRSEWGSAAGYSIIRNYHYDGKKYRLVHQFTKTERQAQ